jgi:uncharacterized membrane protein
MRRNGSSSSVRGSSTAPAPTPIERKAFKVGVILKLIDGVLEILGAAAVWIVRPAMLIALVRFLTVDELAEDPHDFISTHAVAWAHHYSNGTRLFSAAYLLAHGIVKVVLVVALLRRRLWAYPTLIGCLLLFIAYQCYRLVGTHSIALALFTIFDAVIVWLVWREFRRLLRERRAAG